jgi:Dyp-type peroxidase family
MNAEKTSDEQEVLLESDEIQGNILAGFNKDHQTLIALGIGDLPAARAWLTRVAPHISSLSEVAQFNGLFKARRRRLGHDPVGLIATWVNIAFSYDGVAKLKSAAIAGQVPDDAFKDGLPKRAASLGDVPTGGATGTAGWVMGGEGRVPDILLIVASDDSSEMALLADQLTPGTGDLGGAPVVLWKEVGDTRSDLPGHEHFGFKDGVSQPAVRGLLSKSPDVYLAVRELLPPAAGAISFATPGSPLVWPGEFVFGYPSNNDSDGTAVAPAPLPSWVRNGSLLVFRRLQQDVAGFAGFLRASAAALASTSDFPNMTPERLGATLVGRWPSGTPILRAEIKDDPDIAKDPQSVNDFLYANDSVAPRFKEGYGTAKPLPPAKGDPNGFVCPHAAHIRKVNPRDQDSDKGDQFDTLTRRILRRGIPFGPPLPAPPGGQLPADDGVERGLHFLCYQTSIVQQFELLQTDWANSTANPKAGGHDLIIGQPGTPIREVELATSVGNSQIVQTNRTFVMMTGGGYFFSPSISSLQNFLAVP